MIATETIRILLADDHRMIREGLRALLRPEADFALVAEAEDGHTAVRMAAELSPDVVIMDIRMPDLNGIDATRRLLEATPRTKVIGLTGHADDRMAAEMLRAGASGFLLKDVAFDELAQAVRTVVSGKTYLSPRVGNSMVNEILRDGPQSPSVFNTLTAREREVLQLMAEGRATKEVAAHLQMSVKTAETHRRSIMQKLDMDSVAELTKYAIREGLTSVDV